MNKILTAPITPHPPKNFHKKRRKKKIPLTFLYRRRFIKIKTELLLIFHPS